jgi:hypothetical protein
MINPEVSLQSYNSTGCKWKNILKKKEGQGVHQFQNYEIWVEMTT